VHGLEKTHHAGITQLGGIDSLWKLDACALDGFILFLGISSFSSYCSQNCKEAVAHLRTNHFITMVGALEVL
jgi:hypothetical protein